MQDGQVTLNLAGVGDVAESETNFIDMPFSLCKRNFCLQAQVIYLHIHKSFIK